MTLPSNTPRGKLVYVPNAGGGAAPAFWDGAALRSTGDGMRKKKAKPTGPGLFIVGIGPSEGMAKEYNFDKGLYCFSRDGFFWDFWRVGPPDPNLATYLDGGIMGTAYANGAFLFIGFNRPTPGKSVHVIQTHDPFMLKGGGAIGPPLWHTDPPRGYNLPGMTEAVEATEYDEPLGEFTVGDATIWNTLPRAVTPDTYWPWVGDHSGRIVEGTGSQGPVEVKIDRINVTIIPGQRGYYTNDIATFIGPPRYEYRNIVYSDLPLWMAPDSAGTYLTDYISVRRAGTSDWQQVTGPAAYILNSGFDLVGDNDDHMIGVAGLSLRGLLWGPIKDSAVEFLPGDT